MPFNADKCKHLHVGHSYPSVNYSIGGVERKLRLTKKIRCGAPKGGLMLNSDLSQAAPQGGREPPQKNLCGVHAQAAPDKLGLRLDIAAIH